MITLRVLFFATLRDELGCEGLDVVLESGTLAHLRIALTERFGQQLAPAQLDELLWSSNVRLALNQSLWHELPPASSVAFSDGDELAFLPPVTGG